MTHAHIDENMPESLRLRVKSAVEGMFLDRQLAELMRYMCLYGFHEAAHLIACSRESIRDSFKESFQMSLEDAAIFLEAEE